ncbi:hypothetical protein [Chitinimonas naiadis]
MKTRALLYHDGCRNCLRLADWFIDKLDPHRFDARAVNLGIAPFRLPDADRAGVTQLPAWVIDGQVFAINPHSEHH